MQKQYESILIHPTLQGGRCAGMLNFSAISANFTAPEMSHSIAFSQLKIEAGGAGNRFIFFTNPNQPEISIYTADKSVLNDLTLKEHQTLSKDINTSKRGINTLLVSGLLLLGVIIALIFGLYFAKDWMIEKAAQKIPVSWENTVGDKLFSTLSLNYTFIKNDSLKNEFLKVAQPLFTEIEKEQFKIDIYFVNDPTINAFALPGGKVIIQSGLVENAKSWEEVLGVLSHELAHVTRRHHVRSLINNLGIYTIVSISLGDMSALLATIGNMGGDLAALSNSRTFEYEADETGWNYLVASNINPKGMVSFFETLQKQNASKVDSVMKETIDLSFLSTHPDTQDRINRLNEKIKVLPSNFRVLPSNFDSFKERLKAIKQQ